MLVLSRYRQESIILKLPDGQEITVMVVDVRGDSVRIGITADKSISILRGEIADNYPPFVKGAKPS